MKDSIPRLVRLVPQRRGTIPPAAGAPVAQFLPLPCPLCGSAPQPFDKGRSLLLDHLRQAEEALAAARQRVEEGAL